MFSAISYKVVDALMPQAKLGGALRTVAGVDDRLEGSFQFQRTDSKEVQRSHPMSFTVTLTDPSQISSIQSALSNSEVTCGWGLPGLATERAPPLPGTKTKRPASSTWSCARSTSTAFPWDP